MANEEGVCVSASISVSCAFLGGSFSSVCLVLFRCISSCFILLYFILSLSLRSLFSSERQKDGEPGWLGRWGGTERNRRRRNCNYDISSKKRIYCSIKGRSEDKAVTVLSWTGEVFMNSCS